MAPPLVWSTKELLHKRIVPLTKHEPAAQGRYVLYWMQQQRRLEHNFALQHAVFRAKEAKLPLLIYEGLRCDYEWASDRHHAFAIKGMIENRAELRSGRIGYFPWVETRPGAGRGLVELLCSQAAEVVTDDVPLFVVPRHNRALTRIAEGLKMRATAVDANGVLPTRLLDDRTCPTAAVFRRHAHRALAPALASMPTASPLKERSLPAFDPALLEPVTSAFGSSDAWLDRFEQNATAALGELPIAHEVAAIPDRGGRQTALRLLDRFLDEDLDGYSERRSDPRASAASGLAPYLHWGMVSSHEIISAVWNAESNFDPSRLPEKGGSRVGYWPLSDSAQSFLDQIVTWRELGYHVATRDPEGLCSYQGLPGWAQNSLDKHRDDERGYLYNYEQFAAADTHDELWNAAQRQLRQEGMIQNYLRMLWGKKIVEWSKTPEEAFDIMVDLNNRYALDGRNPNSWTGISWCFGRFDRPWQERAILGVIRYMSSDSTRRKFKVGPYIERYGP